MLELNIYKANYCFKCFDSSIKSKNAFINRQIIFCLQLLGVEIDTKYGGAGCNFMTTVLVIEELSKVDPSVSLLVDIQNTLVNAVIKKLGTQEQKDKYLPRLATNTVTNL